MDKRVFVYILLGAIAMIINITFILYTLCAQQVERKRKKGVFRLVYLSLLASNCALLLSPCIMYWATTFTTYSELWCILISYVDWVSSSVNVCSILLISVDRFLAVMNPFRYVKLMKAGRVLGLQTVFIAWSFIMPHISNTSKKKFVYIRQLNFCLPTSNRTLFHSWYLATFIFPATIALSLNVFIIRYLVRRLKVFAARRNAIAMLEQKQVPVVKEEPGKGTKSDKQIDCNINTLFTFKKTSSTSWTSPMLTGRRPSARSQRRFAQTQKKISYTLAIPDKNDVERKSSDHSITQMIPADEGSRGCCISVTGCNEILSNPSSKRPSSARPRPPSREISTTSQGGNFADKSILRHFDVVLRTITGCVAEFVVFTVAWVTVYAICGIAGLDDFPFDVIIIILIHTTVTSVLYSASYTSYTKKMARTKSALLRRYKYL